MEGSGCFRFQNRLSLGNNNGSDQEIDLTLKLGLTNPSKQNQDAPQHALPHHNFSNFDRPTFYHQSMGRSEILQNARGHERERLLGMMKHMPWPLPVLNMLRNNLNMSTGNSAVLQQQQQQQLECKICETTDTPTWRKGPQGPKTLCNRCGLRYAREIKKG